MDHLKVLENVLGSCKELLVELKRWAEVCQTSFFLPLTLQGNLERQALLLWSRDGHADAPHAWTANMRLMCKYAPTYMHVKFWRMTIPSLAIGLVMEPVIRLLTWSVRGVTQVSKVTLVAVNHSYYGQSWGQSTSDQMSSRSQVSKLNLCVKNGTITDHGTTALTIHHHQTTSRVRL